MTPSTDIYARLRDSYPVQIALLVAVIALDVAMSSRLIGHIGFIGAMYGVGLFLLSFTWLRMATRPFPRAQTLAAYFLVLALLFAVGFQLR